MVQHCHSSSKKKTFVIHKACKIFRKKAMTSDIPKWELGFTSVHANCVNVDSLRLIITIDISQPHMMKRKNNALEETDVSYFFD